MDMFEEARSLRTMIRTYRLKQDEMAKKLGVSQSYIANKLRLLGLDEQMQTDITRAGLTERHARALLRLCDESLRRTALEKICERKMTVRESEALIDFLYDGTAPERIQATGLADRAESINSFKRTLTSSLATLTSLGVDAHKSVNTYGTKTYITICIDENSD